MSSLRKHLYFDNQTFYTIHPEGKQLIMNLVESSSLLFSGQKLFCVNSNLIAKC